MGDEGRLFHPRFKELRDNKPSGGALLTPYGYLTDGAESSEFSWLIS